MNRTEQIERLANFMGWEKVEKTHGCPKCCGVRIFVKHNHTLWWARMDKGRIMDGIYTKVKDWNPYENWNHWRQVEEKVMEDKYLSYRFRDKICNIEEWEPSAAEATYDYMKADLETRCNALISLLDS